MLVEYECKECGQNFEAHDWRNNRQFCSLSCSGKHTMKADDNSVFQNGLNQKNAYIMGLIYSDGCLSYDENSDSYRVTISLNDHKMISTLNEIMTPERKIYENRGNYSVVTTNEKDIGFLRSKGITERKTMSLKFPDISPELVSHFIRGYFDGDGSFVKTTAERSSGNYTYIYARFTCGSAFFTNGLLRVLYKLDFSPSVYMDKREDCASTYTVQLSRTEEVQRFSKWIYEDATLFLERKHQKLIDHDIV
jgi:DNA-binding transcriptional regulator WhiA